MSTKDQNEVRQLEAMSNIQLDEIFIDKMSGKDIERTELQNLLKCVTQGDTIYIKDLSRLARSTKDLLELVDVFSKREVNLVSLNENLDITSATSKLMLTLMSAINEFERNAMLERQAEGILEKSLSKTEASVLLGVTRATLNNHLNNFEQIYK